MRYLPFSLSPSRRLLFSASPVLFYCFPCAVSCSLNAFSPVFFSVSHAYLPFSSCFLYIVSLCLSHVLSSVFSCLLYVVSCLSYSLSSVFFIHPLRFFFLSLPCIICFFSVSFYAFSCLSYILSPAFCLLYSFSRLPCIISVFFSPCLHFVISGISFALA